MPPDYPREKLEIQVWTIQRMTPGRSCARSGTSRAQGFLYERLHRRDRMGFKAGAWRGGLLRAHGRFIAILTPILFRPLISLKKRFRGFKTGRGNGPNALGTFE